MIIADLYKSNAQIKFYKEELNRLPLANADWALHRTQGSSSG